MRCCAQLADVPPAPASGAQPNIYAWELGGLSPPGCRSAAPLVLIRRIRKPGLPRAIIADTGPLYGAWRQRTGMPRKDIEHGTSNFTTNAARPAWSADLRQRLREPARPARL